MNWKDFAIQDLRKYNHMKQSLISLTERIEAVECRKRSISSSTLSAIPMGGGGNRYEDNLLNAIVEQERLRLNMTECSKLVELIERGLEGLDDRERRIIESFYVSPKRGHVEELMNSLFVEKSQVYRLKDEALYKFTVRMYGIIDF